MNTAVLGVNVSPRITEKAFALRRIYGTPVPSSYGLNNPDECFQAAQRWAPGLAMRISEDDWRDHGFYGAIFLHFVKYLKSEGKFSSLPKSWADLHRKYPGEFVSWSTNPSARVNFLAQRKIQEFYDFIVKKIALFWGTVRGEDLFVGTKESVNTTNTPLHPATVSDYGSDIPRFLRKDSEVAEPPVEVLPQKVTLFPKARLKFDEETDTLTIQLRPCKEEKIYTEEGTGGFNVSRKKHSRRSKGSLVSFNLYGVLKMLREQKAKCPYIKLEHLIKRFARDYRRNNKGKNVFNGYQEQILAAIEHHEFVWWIPQEKKSNSAITCH